MNNAGRKPGTYALYSNDELLCIGTIREISINTGITEGSIRHYASPCYVDKKRKYNVSSIKTLIRIEEENYEEV